MTVSRSAAIVGVAESDEIGIVPTKSALQHHAEAAHNALADAGLSARDVTSLMSDGPGSRQWRDLVQSRKQGAVKTEVQNLLREQVPIRQLGAILETLGDSATRLAKDPLLLT